MIKIKLGKNLIYLFIYIISWIIRLIIRTITKEIYPDFVYMVLYMYILGEIIGGLSIYLYQYRNSQKNKQTKLFNITLTTNKDIMKYKDKNFKIIILVILASIFDFFKNIIEFYNNVKSNDKNKNNFYLRIGAVTTISSSLLCKYSVNFKFGNHHKTSLIFIGSCLIIETILEIIFKPKEIFAAPFLFERFLTIFRLIIESFNDCTKKYLVEVNYVDPFKLIMYEGFLELIFNIIFRLSKNMINIQQIGEFFRSNSSGKICGLVFSLLGILLLSGLLSLYKIYCITFYSPMIKNLTDYILVPFINILSFIFKIDFYNSVAYFVICEIISIIVDFFGFLYNEFIILYCFGLEHDTKFDISSRVESIENQPIEMIDEVELEGEYKIDLNIQTPENNN